MPIILQEKLVQWILRPLSRITERIPPIIRDTCVSLSVAVMIFMYFANRAGIYAGHPRVLFAVGCLMFGIMIFCGLTPDLKPVRFSRPLTACWLTLILSMLLTSMMVNIFVLLDVITFLVVLPVTYLVWSGPGFDRLFPLAFRGVMISFFFFTVVSVFFYPINGINYASFFSNRNGTGVYLTGVFVCLLCFRLTHARYSFREFVADVVIGFTVATIYYTNCRTAFVAVAACFLTVGTLQLLTQRKAWRRVLLCQLFPITAVIIFMIPFAVYLYHGGYRLSCAVQTVFVSISPDTPDTPPVSDILKDIMDYNEGRFRTEFIGTEDLSPTGSAINSLTKGRVDLWYIHLREVGILGNRSDKILYNSSGEVEARNSHCAIIQYAYQYGALAGISYLLLNILAGLSSIRFAATRQDIKYRLAPFAIAISFGAESVMEWIGLPMGDNLSLMYFLSLAPLVIAPTTATATAER